MASRLESLLADGTLHRTAPTCRTRAELAGKLGMSQQAYESSRKRIRSAGRAFPTFAELQGAHPFVRELIAAVEFEDEPTNPGVAPVLLDRFPSVAAMDAEDPPLPAMSKGYRVKGVSTLVDADGQTKAQWIKTTAIDDGRKDWLEAIRVLLAEAPRYEPIAPVEYSNDKLLSVYPVGDPHIGMMAWHEDAGENFDLKIAERNLVRAFQHLIGLSPASGRALLIFIGDNTHSDGQANTTTAGTRVDVDGRTIKMMRVAVSVARQAIDLALTKHGHVTMIVERGNHDELLSAMLALALSLLYENEPRVTIDTSPEMFHWYRFGAVLIGTHHGHKAKAMDLLGVMAVDRQVDWGETKHRCWYVGHEHHEKTKEVPGLTIYNLPTLASSDAWHRAMGYRSARAMYMDVVHIEHGHVNRHIVGIQKLMEAA